jgi:hypothetical protein
VADREVHGVELPEDLQQEYHVDLTFEIKRKILGEKRPLYGIDIASQTAKLSQTGSRSEVIGAIATAVWC